MAGRTPRTSRPARSAASAMSAVSTHPALDASPMAVLGVAPDGTIAYANPQVERTFGWKPRGLIGLPIETLIPERLTVQHLAHRRSFMERPLARPMGIGLDLAGRRRDGSEFPVEISLAPVATPDGVFTHVTVIDITARKSLEGQLLQAQKMESIGRLAGGIAHDFNNMLFAIRGHAAILRDDLDPDAARPPDMAAVRRSVEAIETAAERAAALTGQLLAFSRQQVVQPVALDLRQAITSLEPLLQRLIGADVRLVLQLDGATGDVRADRSQIDQVLVNLVVNARDAMPGGGTIAIETGNVAFDEPYAVEHFEVTPGEYVMLAVSDTGIGMDRETRIHVFEPFFTTKEPGKGTGLGLATIYGIVRQAGGHIWLYSEPGRGTKFKLYFPRLAVPAREVASEPPVVVVDSGTVLLVEDEPAVRDLTQLVLERAGFRVLLPAEFGGGPGDGGAGRAGHRRPGHGHGHAGRLGTRPGPSRDGSPAGDRDRAALRLQRRPRADRRPDQPRRRVRQQAALRQGAPAGR